MVNTSQSPEHKPLVMAWIATVLTVVVFGGILLVVLTGRTQSPAATVSNQNLYGLASSGEGRVTGVPDLAEVTVGVESRAETPTAASEKSSVVSQAILEAVKGAGVSAEDVQTINVSLFPEVIFDDQGQQSVTGYVSSSSVRVTLRALNSVGAVLDAAVRAGATTVQGVSLSFQPETLRKLEDEARTVAVQDAQRRATVLGQLANVRLGKPLSLSESLSVPDNGPQPFYADAELGGGPASVPFEGGSLEVVSFVDVTYEIL